MKLGEAERADAAVAMSTRLAQKLAELERSPGRFWYND